MIFSPDKNGQIDGTVKRILDQIQTDKVLVPITRLNDYVFNERLYDLKEWILVDYFEYGANHWDRKETHFWGKNTEDFSYVPKTEEWDKFDKFCKDNPPTKILKRELLKKDVADNVFPIEYPSFYVVPDPQTKEEYEKRPIEVFHFWGHSHEIRRAFHGGCFILAAQTGIGVVDNIDYIERSLGEYKRLWVTVNTPHFARRPMEQIYAINGMSKLSVSLEGAGVKCFRHAEASLNSLMVMREDELAWSYEWKHGFNCLKIYFFMDSFDEIKGTEYDSHMIAKKVFEYAQYDSEDFYEIYVNGIQTAKKYQLDNYINNYLQPIINQ